MYFMVFSRASLTLTLILKPSTSNSNPKAYGFDFNP